VVKKFRQATSNSNAPIVVAKSGIQLRYSGTREPSDEYQTSKKYEIAAKINFRIKKRY
jgi:hypothetical protein